MGSFSFGISFPSPSECLLHSEVERNISFLIFLCESRLELPESPREHWPSNVRCVHSPCLRSSFVSFPLPSGFPLGFLSKLLPFGETCLHCGHGNSNPLFFCPTLQGTISFSREQLTTPPFCAVSADPMPWEISIPLSNRTVSCTKFPTYLHRDLQFWERNTSLHSVSKPCTLTV